MSRPFIPASNCVKIELILAQSPLVAENVFYWQSDHALTGAEMTTLAGAIKTSWGTTIKPYTSNSWWLTTIKITGMSSAGEPQVIYTTGLPIQGTLGVISAPPNVSLCVSCRTGYSGRSNRGRWYWIGLPVTWVQGTGILTSANAEFIRKALADFQYDLTWGSNPIDGQHVIASFRNNKAWRDTADIHVVNSYSVTDLNADSQRRRLPGRGRT